MLLVLVKLGGLAEHIATMRRCRRLIFIACGTSYHSALAVWYCSLSFQYIRHCIRFRLVEFSKSQLNFLLSSNWLVIFLIGSLLFSVMMFASSLANQVTSKLFSLNVQILRICVTGETADTLNALRYCKQRGALVVGVTNTGKYLSEVV